MSDFTPSDEQDRVTESDPIPAVSAAAHEEARRRSPFDYAEILLACGWLLVPAAQYFGTFQRTGLQVEGSAASPDLATLDLTPLYVLLVAATIILVALRRFIPTGEPANNRTPSAFLDSIEPEAQP